MKKTLRKGCLKKLMGCLFTAFIVLGALPFQAGAFQSKAGEVDITFDSTFSVGGSIRVEEIDYDLVGKSNQKQFENSPATAADDAAFLTDIADKTNGVPRGAWNPNSDDGDLNFDTGFFSQAVSGVHELDVRYGNHGFFSRVNWFYDHYMMNETDDMRWDIMDESEFEENHGQDIDLLDCFFYSSFNLGNYPMSFRLGSQVINWGEAGFIPHGMNVSNPMNAARFRVPGAEIKDALVPEGTVSASIGLWKGFTVDAYYQYEWEETTIDSPGTYFSTSDVAGPGANSLQLGFSQFADYHSADMNTPANILSSKYFVVERVSDKKADDQGQGGVKLGWQAEALNDTEFNFYYANYHSKIPMLNMDKVVADKGKFIGGYLSPATSDYTLTPTYRLVYPEDIQLFGVSFNTLLPFGIACGGEMAFRKDEPYQIDGQELSFKMLEGLSDAGISPAYAGLSQIKDTVAPGDEIQGYVRLDSINWDINFTKMFNNIAYLDELLVLTEFGCTRIRNMPDHDTLRLETPGTDRSANERRAWASGTVADSNFIKASGGLEGTQTSSSFADDVSWGYVLVTKGTIYDTFWGVNMSPLVVFRHDVDGTAPSSAGTFIQGRKQIDLKLGFDWKQNWSFDLGYTIFTGGGGHTGTANLLEDRDYVSFNLKYSI